MLCGIHIGEIMFLRKLITIKLFVLSILGSNVEANCQQSTLEFESDYLEIGNQKKDAFLERLQQIDNLDLGSLSEDEKINLIQELLDSNIESINLIPNSEIESRSYLDEAGTHSFDF